MRAAGDARRPGRATARDARACFARFASQNAGCIAGVARSDRVLRAAVSGRGRRAERFGVRAGHPDCFERSCVPGHVTGSAWLVSHDRSRFLLTHHRKLGRWLQLGGHSDGDPDTAQVALREAREESGIAALTLAPIDGACSRSISTPTRSPRAATSPRTSTTTCASWSWRRPDAVIAVSEESLALRWFAADRAARRRARRERRPAPRESAREPGRSVQFCGRCAASRSASAPFWRALARVARRAHARTSFSLTGCLARS